MAANLKTIDKKTSKNRLKIIQNELFKNQIEKNKLLEGKLINILVENQMKDKTKLFGRTEYMTSVIFDGDLSDIGELVQVEINSSNRNTLFGEISDQLKQRVA